MKPPNKTAAPRRRRRRSRAALRRAAALALAALLCLPAAGCGGVRNLAKSDIDMVADLHLRSLRGQLAELTVLLYKHNPGELRKTPRATLEGRVDQIVDRPTVPGGRPEVGGRRGVPAIKTALARDFKGDRVFALMVGVSGMLRLSYDDLDEVYLPHVLDPQKIYNSARNLENIALRLRNESGGGKRPLLRLGPATGKGSFERRMGRLIQTQDLMADILEDRGSRGINRLVRGAALLPIGR